jgi:hypothetical protein
MTNPTSNFGWQMPTSTDLVTDLPADFEVFGQAVDTDFVDLLGGTTGQVLSKTSATDLDFTWVTANPGDITGVTAGTGISGGGTSGTVTVSIDTTVTADLTTSQTLTNKTLTSPALTTPTISTLTTNGDLLYGTGSGALARTAIGSTGNVLTVSGGLPVWSAPAGGGGKVLQVVYGSTTTNVNVTNDTFVDSNLTATITPSLASSKVLVLVSQNGCFVNDTSGNGVQLQVFRASTNIGQFAYYLGYSATATRMGSAASASILDTPATTSATIYKTKVANILASGGTISVQHASALSTIILLEIGA